MSDDRGWALMYNQLYGLDVTVAEACEILAARPSPGLAEARDFRVSWASGQRVRLSLRVTASEAGLIRDGRDPLEVLLPKYRARALTSEELLA